MNIYRYCICCAKGDVSYITHGYKYCTIPKPTYY